MNHKLSFILSSVSGIKEDLTADDVENIKLENEVLNENLEIQSEILSTETVKLYNAVDLIRISTISFKILNNVLMSIDFYRNEPIEGINTIVENSTIDEIDIELLIRNKEAVLEVFETHKNEDYYPLLLKAVEELINE
jgi:hypothetical protein